MPDLEGFERMKRSHCTEVVRLLQPRRLVLLLAALASGAAGFVLGMSLGSPYRVFGYVELGRLYRVVNNTTLEAEYLMIPAILAQRLNAGQLVPKQQRGGERPEVSARQLPRAENIVEITVRGTSAEEGGRVIDAILSEIDAETQALRMKTMDRLIARNTALVGETKAALQWRNDLDKQLRAVSARPGEMAQLQYHALAMLRGQANSAYTEASLAQQTHLSAIAFNNERVTRLVMPVHVEFRSIARALAVALAAAFCGALFAAAVLVTLRSTGIQQSV